MKKQLLIAAVAASMASASMADISINGNYEGTLQDGNPGAASYTQDLDLTLVGSTGGSKVTVMMEDLTGGSTVTTNQVFIETSIEGLNFKRVNYKGQSGAGLLKKKSAVANKIEVGADVAGFGVKVAQVSGDGNATVDASTNIAGIDVKVQDLTNDVRFITASTNIAGLDLNLETQEVSTGKTNTGVTASTTVALSESTAIGVAGVYIDVEDTTGVTQDDGILGDISDANNGSSIKAGVATLDTDLGKVTGKYIVKNDLDTYVAKLERGVMEYGYSKTENADAVIDAKLTVSF